MRRILGYHILVRPVASYTVGSLASSMFLACSALLTFHDKPYEEPLDEEGGALEDVAPTGDDAPPEAGDDDDTSQPVFDSGQSDTQVRLEAGPDTSPDPRCTHPCLTDAGTVVPKGQGSYCGSSRDLSCNAGPLNFVYCSSTGVATLTACDAGCVLMNDPHPDYCNPCVNKPPGYYCGFDLLSGIALATPGTANYNGNVVIHCAGSALPSIVYCSASCSDGGCL
jgi:hypothetical protein